MHDTPANVILTKNEDGYGTGLEDEGFEQNKVDPYIFVRNNFIVICYVDDCCIFSKDREKLMHY